MYLLGLRISWSHWILHYGLFFFFFPQFVLFLCSCLGGIVASQFGSGVCGDSCGGSISSPSVLHAPVQLVCRYSLLLCTKVLWKALGHPGCGFPFQMITAFFQSSDCSNSFSSAVKARRSPPLRINLVEG